MASKANSYEVKDIEVHRGLEGIRKRPSLYVSDTGSAGVVHLAKEVITNACDEAVSGNATAINIFIEKDGCVSVADNGRGIPVGKHPKGRDALAIVFTETHSGSKMKDKDGAYDKSAGTYGVGLAVVTALSSEVEVWSYRNKRWNYLAFSGDNISNNGVPTTSAPDFDYVVDKKRGTLVRFKPNMKLFNKGAKLDVRALVEWISDQSWFVPAVITVTLPDGTAETFHREGGLLARFEDIVGAAKEEPLLATEDDTVENNVFTVSANGVDLLIGWSSDSEATIMSYASAHRTIHHGEHVKGILAELPNAFEMFTKRGDGFSKASLQAGIVIIVNCSIPNPKFNGQAKTMLTSESAGELAANVMREHFVPWLKKRKTLARAIISKANSITEITSAFKASKKLASKVRGPRGKSGLPAKLRVSTTKDTDARELFICEGLSAEGSLLEARDVRYQEVLALTGKPPNLFKKEEKLHTNERVLDILKAVGYDPDDPGARRVGRIIVFADADSDGKHISALVLGMLQRVMPQFVAEGRVCIIDGPLFIYRTDTTYIQGSSLNDIRSKVKNFDPRRVQRLKGWGEAGRKNLEDIATNPATRKLKVIRPAAATEEYALLVDVLGEDTTVRKKLLGI